MPVRSCYRSNHATIRWAIPISTSPSNGERPQAASLNSWLQETVLESCQFSAMSYHSLFINEDVLYAIPRWIGGDVSDLQALSLSRSLKCSWLPHDSLNIADLSEHTSPTCIGDTANLTSTIPVANSIHILLAHFVYYIVAPELTQWYPFITLYVRRYTWTSSFDFHRLSVIISTFDWTRSHTTREIIQFINHRNIESSEFPSMGCLEGKELTFT